MNYAFVTQFVTNCVSFCCKGNESNCVGIKFHMVSSTPTAYGISVTL
jgi:hypothetical protein